MEKAMITNTVTGENIEVQFNPEEYSVNRATNFASTPILGLSAPILQFVHGNMQTLEMELFLDTREAHQSGSRTLNEAGEDVRNLTGKITGLMDIDASTHAPPVLLFTWASLTFTCVLASANQRFVFFREDGIPTRARIQVTFNEYRNTEMEAKEVKRETADYTKVHRVGQGETLCSVAQRHYGDSKQWRPIAHVNTIDDPAQLETGAVLVLPRLPYTDPDTGEVMS